MNSSTKHKKQK